MWWPLSFVLHFGWPPCGWSHVASSSGGQAIGDASKYIKNMYIIAAATAKLHLFLLTSCDEYKVNGLLSESALRFREQRSGSERCVFGYLYIYTNVLEEGKR